MGKSYFKYTHHIMVSIVCRSLLQVYQNLNLQLVKGKSVTTILVASKMW